MITQIIGRLVEKTPTQVVIDCNGVGYAVHISLHTFSQIGNDENIKLFTHQNNFKINTSTYLNYHTIRKPCGNHYISGFKFKILLTTGNFRV